MGSPRLSPRSALARALLAALLLVAAGSPLPAASGRGPGPSSAPAPAPSTPADPLDPVRAAVERAFVRGDAAPLRPYLPRRAKIYIAPGVLEVADGYYGADQVAMILRRLFERRTTVRVKCANGDAAEAPGGRRLLPIRWVYRGKDATKSERRLVFTIVPEGSAWHIREIRDWK